MKVIREILTLVLATATLGGFNQVMAISIEANPNGRTVETTLGPQHANQKEVEFYTVVKGNMTAPFAVALYGPAGVKGKVEAIRLKKSVQNTLGLSRGWDRLESSQPLIIRSNAVSSTSSATNGGYQTAAANLCDFLTPQLIAQLAAIIPAYAGKTKEEICAIMNGGGVSSPPPGSSPPNGGSNPGTDVPFGQIGLTQAYVLLHRDTCVKKDRSRYVVRMLVNIEGVDPAEFNNGFSLKASFDELPYQGRTAASIKPTSDTTQGRFAGKPLLLMSSTGGYFGSPESIDVYKWNRKGRKKIKTLRVEGYVYYKGLVLTRSDVSSVLRGGKATFELSNGRSIYSVCFKLQRTRQRVNGYP